MLALPIAANAETSGQCGDDVTWKQEGTKLIIRGQGEMWDNRNYTSYFSKDITEVSIGSLITGIGNYAFADLPNLSTVDLGSVNRIGTFALH